MGNKGFKRKQPKRERIRWVSAQEERGYQYNIRWRGMELTAVERLE